MNRTVQGLLSGLGAASIWGGMYVVSKVVLEVVPPFALITTRLLLGSLVLLIIIAIRGAVRVTQREFWQVFAVGAIGYGVSLGLQFVGTKLSTAANGSLVTSATPAFILVFAWALLGERITRRQMAALAVSTVGVLAVVDPRSASAEPDLFLGNISLIGAALTWALYSVLVRLVTRRLDVLLVSLIAFLGGLPIAITGGIWELGTLGIGRITPGILAGILFLGIIATALAMALWNNCFAMLDANIASLTFFAQPLVGSLLGWIFLQERITPLFLFGGLLIGAGLVIASRDNAT